MARQEARPPRIIPLVFKLVCDEVLSPGRSFPPRSGRDSAGGSCCHEINQDNARVEVFPEHADFGALVRVMGEACVRVPMRVVAY
jgi:hypothetical protein